MSLDYLPPTTAPAPAVEVRELTPEEVQSTSEVFAAAGVAMPSPMHSTFVGAVQDGKVLGFLVLQLQIHAEPLHINEGRSDLFLPIVNAAKKLLLERVGQTFVYVFAPAGKVSTLASRIGMQLEPWCVFSMPVLHDFPVKLEPELPEVVYVQDEVEEQDELRNEQHDEDSPE